MHGRKSITNFLFHCQSIGTTQNHMTACVYSVTNKELTAGEVDGKQSGFGRKEEIVTQPTSKKRLDGVKNKQEKESTLALLNFIAEVTVTSLRRISRSVCVRQVFYLQLYSPMAKHMLCICLLVWRTNTHKTWQNTSFFSVDVSHSSRLLFVCEVHAMWLIRNE